MASADPLALVAFADALGLMADELKAPMQRLAAEALAYQLKPHPGGPDLSAYAYGFDPVSQCAARLGAIAESVRQVGLAFVDSDIDLTGGPGGQPRHFSATERRVEPATAEPEGDSDVGVPIVPLVTPRSRRRGEESNGRRAAR